MIRDRLIQDARQNFTRAFGSHTNRIAAAPGRVNLIGEHTDYNDGFVLPMAIDRHVVVAFAPREDLVVRAHSIESGETREVSLETRGRRTATDAAKWGKGGGGFGDVAGVSWARLGTGHAVRGADLAIVSDLPVAAGLSSSAALEMAVARALAEVSELTWDARAFA